MGLLDFLRGRKTKAGKDPEIRDKDPYIFISYALANADEVFRIVRQFQNRGYHFWCDKGIAFGDERTDTSTDALEHAALFLVFLSPESEALVKVRHEINYALNADKPFLAVYLKKTNLTADLQLRLAAKQAIRKYDMSDEEFFDQCSFVLERLGLFKIPSIQNPTTYGLFYEEAVLPENAISNCDFSDADLMHIKNRLSAAERYRDADYAAMTSTERIAENLRRAWQTKPPDVLQIKELLDQCTDDTVLYNIACNTDTNPEMTSIREKAARLIRSRDYRYALSSHILNPARTAMILNLYDSLEGDELFISRTILTDPNDVNKAHMLLFCEDENLLMLGWLYVYGERRFCKERLHALGSDYPEAYLKADPGEKAELEQEWIDAAAETALEIFTEDNEVRERTAGTASVDSEPLRLFLSIRHPRKAVRWWHARKLDNPAYIAYVGSWTSDDQIKEALSVKINSTALITEMIFGDLSGADLVFATRKPEDLTLQNRFCIEIMKNHPDRTIREHVRKELLRGSIEIPGTDLSKPDPLYKDK